MKITGISGQQKNPNRASIYVDGAFAFSLSIAELADAKLHVNDEISSADQERYIRMSKIGKLYDRALRWLLIRMRSVWEVRSYLDKHAEGAEEAEKVLERFAKQGLTDDQQFAERWVSNRRRLKPVSRYRLKQELIQKHVPRQIIDTVLADDETTDVDTIRQIIAKRAHSYSDPQKLKAYLARQGYRYDDIQRALQDNDTDQ